MKKFLIQSTFYITIITTHMPAHGMNALYNKIYASIENPKFYGIGVKIINTTANIISHCGLWCACNLHDMEHEVSEQIAEHNIEKIKQNLLDEEQKTIKRIYNDFNISADQQSKINLIDTQSKTYERKYLSHAHEQATQDIPFPPQIISLLQKIGIHPNSIKIVKMCEPDEDYNAIAVGLIIKRTIENNIVTIHENIKPPTITLLPHFFTFSQAKQLAIWAHEVTHIALQHHSTSGNLAGLIASIAGIKRAQIYNNKNFKSLKIIQERQADILHKSAGWANMMRCYRAAYFYPKTLFWYHYAQLVLIDELHKFPERLKKYQTLDN